MSAAQELANTVNIRPFQNDEKLNLIGHSHGGNILLAATHLLNRPIDLLITFGTPVRDDYRAKEGMIKKHINVYSSDDKIQVMGGYNISKKYLGTRTTYAPNGARHGRFNDRSECESAGFSCRTLPEFGKAGRTFPGALNVDVSDLTNATDPNASHSDLYQNPAIWERVRTYITDSAIK